MNYKFEQRVDTLADNAVSQMSDAPFFEVQGIHFSHWDFNHTDGWLGDAWLAKDDVEANSLDEAHTSFMSRLIQAVSRIAFVSQCYTEFVLQPYLVTREDLQLAYFRYTQVTDGVSLMFMDEELEALKLLLEDKTVPEEFFYYWNDAVNSIGYPAKLLLMFSALEALAKTTTGKKDFARLESILGRDLKENLFGRMGDSSGGLRHRLVHGEYFQDPDQGTNYLEEIHGKVMAYFNHEVLKKDLLKLGVVSPQRHILGNRRGLELYVKPRVGNSLNLKSVLADFDKNGIDNLKNYESVFDEGSYSHF